MRKWLVPVLLAVVLGTTGPLVASHHPAHTLDEAWIKGALAGDVEALVALYAPDAVLYTPGVLEARGTDAIRKELTGLLTMFRVKDMKIDAVYETTGGLSIGWGRFTMHVVPKTGGGPPQTWEGRASVVAKRVGGKWLYVSDHASMPMPAPPAGAKPSAP